MQVLFFISVNWDWKAHSKWYHEFVMGGPEQDKPGRSKGKKKLVVLGIERVTKKKEKKLSAGHTHKPLIASSEPELADFFHAHLDENADITIDGCVGMRHERSLGGESKKK